MPIILPYDDESVLRAADELRAGGIVAFATETVYGLGADTFNASAVRRIYELKGRPLDNPLIAHVIDAVAAKRLVTGWDHRCDRLASRFWPGPLTMILPRHPDVPQESVAGLGTIAVRSPRQPLARSLLYAFGGPISAPSANRSGHVSPTTAMHVADDFRDSERLLILDGGLAGYGIESTVVDLTGDRVTVLRPGSITLEQIRRVLGRAYAVEGTEQGIAPGTSPFHYAPRRRATIVPSESLAGRLDELARRNATAAVLALTPTLVGAPHQVIVMPDDADGYARHLYRALREADTVQVDEILIELPPEREGVWLAVHDRLTRATRRPESA
ncbi:MAG: threonylcarbamoyl-AMP synthase [Phycisphaeraceae bacterium]|nr:threonylcarbamoyl-AMP synthase [Phycisphaeraceae bacterium]